MYQIVQVVNHMGILSLGLAMLLVHRLGMGLMLPPKYVWLIVRILIGMLGFIRLMLLEDFVFPIVLLTHLLILPHLAA